MMISVNKTTGTRQKVQYAALSTGTISHVWYDEESASAHAPKRRNRIKLTREKAELIQRADNYDA